MIKALTIVINGQGFYIQNKGTVQAPFPLKAWSLLIFNIIIGYV